ncbi:MAG: excinuclease ABC subunit UvrC, partial [Ruminiclostridium sp.]
MSESYNDRLGFLRDKANKLTMSPGVYLMKDKSGKIIYVGKAKALKNRVTTYFHSIENHNPKTYKLVSNIYDFDFIVCPSELDALVLEASLIKLHNPKYNIMLKDDKGYNYIKITMGDFPRLSYSLNTNDENADYIGPYTSGYTVKQTVEDANKIFMLPSCNKVFPRDFKKERPCLNYQIKRCMGVCTGRFSAEEYGKIFNSALDYIKSGSKDSIERLRREMEEASDKLEFEKAAKLRDQIAAIERADRSQKIMSDKTTDYDIVALAQNMELTSVAVVKYRGGRLIDKENFYIGDEYDPSQMRSDFLVEYYSSKQTMPKEIYIDREIEDKALLEEYFRSKFGHKVSLIVPQRGEGLNQIVLARNNASEYLSLKVGRTAKEINALEDLAKLLGLPKIPMY